MIEAEITVKPGEKSGRIRPELYGHFAEHLGRCVYEGLWTGEDSEIPNENGIRTDTVAALARIRPPVVRWPGGCFADNYHWRDGIGPHDERPSRPNIWWDQEDTNAFGTHEFIATCRMLGTEPFICLNVGSGSPQEALEWVEYCNYAGDSSMSQLRRKNGAAEPWNVRWWAVGNENWGCGGGFTPRDYAKEYRRFTTYLHRFDSRLEFVACGHTTRDWNPEFLDELRDSLHLVNHLSIHRYVHFGDGKTFTRDEHFAMMDRGVAVMDEDIRAAAGVIRAYTRDTRFIGVALDEWGVWHPQAVNATGLYQPNTLRDGLFAASSLHMFHRHANVLTMANIAQTLNVLQCLIATDGKHMALTPTYYAYDLLKNHQGADAVRADIVSPMASYTWNGSTCSVSVLDAAASERGDGTLTLTVVNRDPEKSVTASVGVGAGYRCKNAEYVTGPDVATENIPGGETLIAKKRIDIAMRDGVFTRTFPARSISALHFRPESGS
jgi:alpha-L-arabinofuranosidase